MGDIVERKLSGGRRAFYCRYTDADGRRHMKATDARSRTEAQEFLDEIESRIRRGQVAIIEPTKEEQAKKRLTVRELAVAFTGSEDKFQSGHGAEAHDPRAYRRGQWSILTCHILPTLGGLAASAVKRSDVVRLKDKLLAEGRHNRTAQKALTTIGKMFEWAREREVIDCANPARGITKPRTKPSVDWYTVEEISSLTTAAEEHFPDLYPIVAAAYGLGARRGELAALRVSDVNLGAGIVTISRSWKSSARKSGNAVTVPLHDDLAAILAPLIEGREPADLLFPADHGGMRDKFCTWGIRELVEKAKVRHFKKPWHAIRHSTATHLTMGGANLAEVRDMLGQTTLAMSAIYAHVSKEALAARVRALPAAFGKAKVIPIDRARRTA